MMFAAMAAVGLALAAPAAAVQFTVNFGSKTTIPGNNNYRTQLGLAGLGAYVGVGGRISLTGPAEVTFEFMGAESGYKNSFIVSGAGGFTFQELGTGLTPWGAQAIGTPQLYAAAGPITNWSFRSDRGSNQGPFGTNTEQFGIFVPTSATGSYSSNVLYLGFDDEPGSDDDNHDDLVIRVTATALGTPGGVPEPASWAMLIAGFGLVGAAQRRRKAIVAV
jgi:hypothetical protein